jgi:hypothetical protein
MAPQPRLDEERPRPQRPVQRRPLRAPETASGGLRRGAQLRAGRSGLQSLTASGENRPRYDRMRRRALLPQSNQPSNACSLARNGVYQLGGQLKSFGTASSVAGLGLGVLGLATSEGGGEVLLPGAVWFVRGGTAASALGAGLQTYAAGGRSPITSGAIAAVQTYAADFATGGLASSALRGVVGKEATEQFANAAGLIRDKLSEVEANCGAGK